MRNFQKRQRHSEWKNILESRIVLIFLGALLLLFIWGIVGFMNKMKITIQNRKIAEVKMVELEKQKEKLTSDINRLNTSSGVEASIREKFGLVKDGEGEIVIVEDKTQPVVPVQSSGGFWNWVKSFFK
jgi:cell division protein FtsB